MHLTIRLRARDFYEVIVDEGESEIKHYSKFARKNIEKRELEAI